MPNAILVVMVLAVGNVLCITHCHLLATVPRNENRHVGEGELTSWCPVGSWGGGREGGYYQPQCETCCDPVQLMLV